MPRHEYLTNADFPTYKPVFGIDEETGEDHGTEAERDAGFDALVEQVQTLVPGSYAVWSADEDGVAFLVYWDPTPGVAEDYANRETDDPEVEAVFFHDSLSDAISSIELMWIPTRDKVDFLLRMAD